MTAVSVVMAVYNGRRFLQRQLESILAQLQEGDELIVIDDASTDDSAKLVLAAGSPPVRLFTNTRNLGVVRSFERGLMLASRPIVLLSDQDDVWLAGKRAAYVAEFERDPALTLVVSDAQVIDAEGNILQQSYMQEVRGGFAAGALANLVRNRFLGCVMGFRRELLEVALPIPRSAPMHDMWLGMMATVSGKVRFIPDAYLQYRRHGANVSPLRSIATIERMLAWRLGLLRAVVQRRLGNMLRGRQLRSHPALMRMVLVEQYFYPEGWGGAEIPRDISIALRQSGFAVQVLCGSEQYAPVLPTETVRDPAVQGVVIRRIPKMVPGPVRRMRMLRVLWFCACAAPTLIWMRRVDVVATQTNPPLVVPVVAAVCALRRIPFIIIAQDVYPEVLFASGVTDRQSLFGRILILIFSWAYRRAYRVITLGEYMKRLIEAKGVDRARMITISNWATGDLRRETGPSNPLRERWELQNRFVVLYSGNLGVGHEFETFMRGVRLAAVQEPRISVVFIGDGSRLEEVRGLTRELELGDQVFFRDRVPSEELPLTMGLADLALVTLRAGFEGVVVPSKLLGYMARGVPVLYVGPASDASEMILSADCGVSCPSGDSLAVGHELLRIMRDPELIRRWATNGRGFYDSHFARELALERYVDVVRSAAMASGG